MQDASAFLSFLPLDNSSSLAEAEQVVELSSSSLRACLDSYLKNCRLVEDTHKQDAD